MKQRKVSTRLVLGAILLSSGFMLNVQQTHAEDITGRAKTEFQPNPNVVPPVDPGDNQDITPIHPPTAGPLSINYASDISFGQHKKQRKDETFYAKEDTVTVISSGEKRTYPNFVQVTDLRGTASGWLLSVRQNGPFKNEKNEALTGAKMQLTAYSAVSQDGMPQKPTGLTKNQVLSDDGSTFHPIVKAEAQTGIGMWTIFLGEPNKEASGISLSVPKNVPKAKGKYTTTLTWSLQDAL